jgi:hypothetical protein
VFYLFCGAVASFAHILANPSSTEPAIGASGAIAGVLGCYMRLFPLARVVVVVPIIFIPLFFEIHAFVFVGFVQGQVLQGTARRCRRPAKASPGGARRRVPGRLCVGPLLLRSERYYRPYYRR